VSIPHPHTISNIALTKNGIQIPEYLLFYSITDEMSLEIDTGRALFDHIRVYPAEDWTCPEGTCKSLIYVSDYEDQSEWQGEFTPIQKLIEKRIETPHDDDETAERFSFNLLEFIASRPCDELRDQDSEGRQKNKNKFISVTGYNGEIVLLFRLQYLFEVVDEFIIIESWYAHNGEKKPFLFFTAPGNAEQFAPYMSKVTYIVMEEFPPMTPQWNESYSQMFPLSLNEMQAFWNEDAQNFLSAPSLVVVTTALKGGRKRRRRKAVRNVLTLM